MQKWISNTFEGLEVLHETRSIESNLLSQVVFLCIDQVKIHIFITPKQVFRSIKQIKALSIINIF